MVISFEDFKAWSNEYEEHFNQIESSKFVQDAYEEALHYVQPISDYLPGLQFRKYVYNYAMHNIICTPLKDNPLFFKYFPESDKDSPAMKNVGSLIASASDNSSSITNIIYEGLNSLNVNDASLLTTEYGKRVKVLNDSLKNINVVTWDGW